ncbi:hypothetical protein HPC49_52280 [Pyxidicoccus fallax]|uniref:Uncharacterized protein n=1 Tax=Pyxidicoccus fallax TaxID=394095 RepID=A0A848M248_9BACT|nr:hypothetical protein [Pyxidicoccus fallax]NMO23404.1 hypothetical protein [Pyxidicoccus fallax]NPC86751.1 hypothetical protein [Pyxidicoccus fallax]
MLPLLRWLSPDEATTYLRPYKGFRTRGARLGMDVDPQVLAHGFNKSGAGVFSGGRVPSLALENPKRSTFIEGDLIVDGWLENPGGLVFVRGNLVAQTLYTSGYLIVLGELRVRRLFGEDEPHGTYVFGDAYVESAFLSHNHHFDVWGRVAPGVVLESENGHRLSEWGVGSGPRWEDTLDDVRHGLRALAERWGPVPEDWASRRYTLKPEEVAEAERLQVLRPPVLTELEEWLRTTELTQRQQLEELRARWLPRLGDAAVRPEAARLIRKALNSKKLTGERDALLKALE